MATVLMSIEGVLTEGLPPGSNLMHYESSDQGKVVYHLLRDTSRLVLLSEDSERDRVKAWLARERFGHYADVHCYPVDSLLNPPLWRVQHCKDLMGAGHHISLYVDCDPSAVEMALEAGMGVMLIARPGEVPGRTEETFRPWYSLVETIEEQNLLRAAKAVEATDG